jgi:endonuclease-3
MSKKERFDHILDYFRQQPRPTTELEFQTTYQLLVAVVLSAQCTDKRVNMVTPELFRHYPDAKTMAQAEADDVLEYISSVSYPNAKAKHLVEMARMVMSDFAGEVPQTMDDLQKLPGVGRKTANVIQAVAYGKGAMPVDTHVFRVSHRMGLVSEKANTPLKVEMELRKNIAEDVLADAHHWLLLHGRYVCQSRKPKCDKCPFTTFCPKKI